MRKIIQYKGSRFGFLTALRFKEKRHPNSYYWTCLCDCGKKTVVAASNLRSGTTQSCGCGIKKSRQIKHGLSRTPIYRTWTSMKDRCFRVESTYYCNYGGRGIGICHFLQESPANIIAMIGKHPGPTWSIDRIDNDGSYTCGQCDECKSREFNLNIRWATRKQQRANRRR